MQSIETSTQLFSQAATLMVVGMVFVFGFLGLMILVIKFLITPLAKRFPDVEPQVITKKTANHNTNEKSAVVAAISVAVKQYRAKNQ